MLYALGFVTLKGAGRINHKKNFLIMPLLGASLKDISRDIKRPFSLKTVFQIALQLVNTQFILMYLGFVVATNIKFAQVGLLALGS